MLPRLVQPRLTRLLRSRRHDLSNDVLVSRAVLRSGVRVRRIGNGLGMSVLRRNPRVLGFGHSVGGDDGVRDGVYRGCYVDVRWKLGTKDYLLIALFSTGPGTLQVQQGTTKGRFPVTASINTLQLASGETNSGVNGITAVLTRSSAQVFSYFAPITFTGSPSTYNLNASVFSGP
ncbi:hypothetical protein FRC05_004982 [Tulasnella sp. 425]|nr:hypothetical protein FRC05_004982 [Tulasnella sp. 425]